MSAELCTGQGDRIKTALESLKDFGPESIIVFRREEVELIGQDHAHVVDIRLLLPADKIRETGGYYRYDCADDQIELGIRTKVVATALKRFSPGDRVVIGARRGTQREFYVSCKNGGKNFTSEIVAPMVGGVDGTRMVANPNVSGMFKYNGSIIMNSAMFHSIVGDLITAEPPVIVFDSDGGTLRLSGEGMFSRSCVEIGDSKVIAELTPDRKGKEKKKMAGEEEDEEEDTEKQRHRNTAVFQKVAPGSWDVHESYATCHLQRIAKAKNMSPRITLSIAQGVPASFEYDTPIGKLTYIVCARTVEDIDDPKFKGPGEPKDPAKKRRRFAVSEPVSEFDSDGEGTLIADGLTANTAAAATADDDDDY